MSPCGSDGRRSGHEAQQGWPPSARKMGSGPTQSLRGRTDAGWSCLQSRLAGGEVMRPPPSSGLWPLSALGRSPRCSFLYWTIPQ